MTVVEELAEQLVRKAGGTVTSRLPLVNGLTADVTPAVALVLAKLPAVAGVTLDGAVNSTAVETPAANVVTTYNKSDDALDTRSKYTGKGVGVAVVDTGIQGDHRDFRTGSTHGTSRVKVSVVANSNATTANDAIGHGTHGPA